MENNTRVANHLYALDAGTVDRQYCGCVYCGLDQHYSYDVYTEDRYYCVISILCTDRRTWDHWDFAIVSDCLFALGSVLTVCRMTYILAFHHKTGPLVVSLTQMIVVSHILLYYDSHQYLKYCKGLLQILVAFTLILTWAYSQ